MAVTLNQNEYFTGLVNYILFMRTYATNRSHRERSITDVFATETLEFGDQKAFPFAEIPSVEDYSLTSSLLTDKPIKYSTEFIGNPIKKKISLTRVEPFLRMAMMSSGGMSTFVSYILGLMETAKEDYLYNQIMSDIFSWTPTVTVGKEMNRTVSLLEIDDTQAATEINAAELINQKRIELAWQKAFDDFSIYTDLFIDVDNATGDTNFKTAFNPEDLIFIGNAKYLNERVVNLMATLLKSDVIDKNFRRPTVLKIPEITCNAQNGSNVIGFVAHKYWYQWFYHFTFMGSFFDPDTVRIKNVLHFWYSRGILKNLPVMKLTVA